jgi:shikimate kinase
MSVRNKVYIIGFMGSGKTTTGHRLARMLGWPFTDLDSCIEERLGMKISEVFSVHGESYFRTIEAEMLRGLDPLAKAVVSTGGGTPCFDGNMDFMLGTGLTVYLRMTPSQIRSRISGTGGDRPLIRDMGDEELLSFISERLEQREKWYGRAELTVSGFDTDIRSLCDQIMSKLQG